MRNLKRIFALGCIFVLSGVVLTACQTSSHHMANFKQTVNASAISQAKVVEVLTVQLADGVQYADFYPVQLQVAEQYAKQQKGFIARQSMQGENGEWVVIVYWASLQDAQNSMQKFASDPTAEKFMQMIKPETMVMKRYQMESYVQK